MLKLRSVMGGGYGLVDEKWNNVSVVINSTKLRRIRALVWPIATYVCEAWTPINRRKGAFRHFRAR